MAERGIEVHVLPADVARRRAARASAPDGVFFSNGPGDPATADHAVGADARRARAAACRSSASASATRSSAARSASAPTSCATATAASTSRCRTGPPARSRSPRTTTASRSTRRSTGRPTPPFGRGRGQPRLPQRRRRRGPALPRRAGVHACSTTPRRRPARTTPRTCSTGSSTLMADERDGALMPRRDDIASRPGHRLRADRHRPGLRVRLLRHPGLPGAARRGPAGRPGQLATRRRS